MRGSPGRRLDRGPRRAVRDHRGGRGDGEEGGRPFYKKNGKEKAIAEFQKSPGPFVYRDVYVSVYDMEGNALSHINPRMVGKNLIDMRDPDGKYLVRERVEAARVATSGWQEFKFFNPQTKKVEPKRMYWEKHDGMLFASGAYKPS